MFRGTGWNALLQQDSICLIDGKWTINGVGVTEHDIHDVIARKYSHYPEQIIEKAMRYIKTHWDEDVTREMSREINREIIRMEKTLTENTKIPVRSKDEHDEAEMYCLLGEICERAAEHQIAAFWFKKAALFGNAKGEGKTGIAFFRMYGAGVEDLEEGYIGEFRDWMSDEKALFWLRRALTDGWSKASRYIKSIEEMLAERENETLDDLIRNAEEGTCIDRFRLASLYETGDECKQIPVDYEEAVYWYKQSLKCNYVPLCEICYSIAELSEEKLQDKESAWKYYRKAYCLQNKGTYPELLVKIQKLETEVIPDKADKERALDVLLQKETFSADELRRMAMLIEETQIPIFPSSETLSEEKRLIQALPKAEILVRKAFQGYAVAENALGVFYSHGMVLPLDYKKQEYWFRCAYMDGYERAYDNLCETFMEQENKDDEWLDFIITSARHGNQKARTKCGEVGVDCTKLGLSELEMLDMYPVESLICNEPTEAQIALIEQFSQTDEIHEQKEILRQLVPSTTDFYLDAYLNGKPYPEDSLLDKIMDTEDDEVRRELVKDLPYDLPEIALREIPYMPLTDAEKRCINRYEMKQHSRSPHRAYSDSEHWHDISDKNLIVGWMMDGDHRLSYDVANLIFDRYETRMIEIDAKRQAIKPDKKTQRTEEYERKLFTLETLLDFSRYMKRQAFMLMKMCEIEITDGSLEKETFKMFMNHLIHELNPVVHPLSCYSSSRDFSRVKEEFIKKQEKQKNSHYSASEN